MTMPNNGAPRSIEIPPPRPPVLTRMVSDSIFSEKRGELNWVFGEPHPIVPETFMIIRMFADRGGVEIYSVSSDGKRGIRDTIPMSKVRFLGEEMPLDVFSDELFLAEDAAAPVGPLSVESEDDDDDDDEPDPNDPSVESDLDETSPDDPANVS